VELVDNNYAKQSLDGEAMKVRASQIEASKESAPFKMTRVCGERVGKKLCARPGKCVPLFQ
jgi:hypothetical protein